MLLSSAAKKIYFHVIGISVFLMLPLLLAPRPAGVPLLNQTLPALRDFLAGVLMIGFFYLNYFLIVPVLFLRKKYFAYFFVVLVAFGVIITVPSFMTGYSPFSGFQPSAVSVKSPPESVVTKPDSRPPLPPEGHEKMGSGLTAPNNDSFILSISHNILLFLSVIMFSIFLRLQERLFKTEQAKNRMEILSLREQINPHFLFNMLNNIYGQAILDNSRVTAQSILKLSDLLRYVVHEAQKEHVPLQKELEYLENYIQLQRQRIGESVVLKYLVKGIASDRLSIAPLILIPFIENAFKHGVNPNEKSLIDIEISIKDPELFFKSRNKKVSVDLPGHKQSGAGLKITQSRLDLLYPDRHHLVLEDTEDDYIVTLKLDLDDHSDSH